MDPTNPDMSFTSMLNNTTNSENTTNIPTYQYPPYSVYQNMSQPNMAQPNMAQPNYGGTPMQMYNYGGTPMQMPMRMPMPMPMPMYNYPAQHGYGMAGNFSPEPITPKVNSMIIPEDNISATMSLKNEESSDTPVPLFCTQEKSKDKGKKKREDSQRWSFAEEKALAEAWVTISTDASTGTNQDGDAFWLRITMYFNKYNKEGSIRNLASVKSRFFRAQPEINRFNECYNQIYNQYASGWSDDQRRQAAHEAYRNETDKKFNLEHMWEITKENVKWNSAREERVESQKMSGSKRTSSNTEEEVSVRPMGTKAAKARKKGKNKKGAEDSNDEELANYNKIEQGKLDTMNRYLMIDELALLNADTSGMTNDGRRLHEIMTTQIRAKYNLN